MWDIPYLKKPPSLSEVKIWKKFFLSLPSLSFFRPRKQDLKKDFGSAKKILFPAFHFWTLTLYQKRPPVFSRFFFGLFRARGNGTPCIPLLWKLFLWSPTLPLLFCLFWPERTGIGFFTSKSAPWGYIWTGQGSDMPLKSNLARFFLS